MFIFHVNCHVSSTCSTSTIELLVPVSLNETPQQNSGASGLSSNSESGPGLGQCGFVHGLPHSYSPWFVHALPYMAGIAKFYQSLG